MGQRSIDTAARNHIFEKKCQLQNLESILQFQIDTEMYLLIYKSRNYSYIFVFQSLHYFTCENFYFKMKGRMAVLDMLAG